MRLFFLLIALAMPGRDCMADVDVLTPAANLAGVKQMHERIEVSLDLKGAEEFSIDASEVSKIVRTALGSAGVALVGPGDYKVPSVHVRIAGESTGLGGANFSVEVVVSSTIPSPFAKDRSVNVIVWRAAGTASQIVRFDPAAKDLVKPSGTIRDRVYETVRTLAGRLGSEAKAASL